MRLALRLALLALLLVPSTALACGEQPQYDTAMAPGWTVPTVAEVEDAIDAAAVEFGVPVSILQAVAHTESRWQHRPYRITMGERRGVFNLSQNRQEVAAALLGVEVDLIRGDVTQHARAFAALLDSARPKGAEAWQVGLWREAIAWSLELPESFADQYVDWLFVRISDGLIDQLPTGEPVTISPMPIEASQMGLWSASTERNPDYPGAVWNPTSCNFQNASRTTGDVDVVIVHTVQGSYSGCISWFHNCSAYVSAHYVVSSTGAITQVVDEADIGWHVSCWNSFSIGIEHEGYVDEPEIWYTDAMYAASAGLTANILADWGLPADRSHVMGHVEIDPGCNGNGHTDPGTGWDWDYYMTLIGGSTGDDDDDVAPDPTDLVGYVRHTDLYDADYGISGATVTVDGGIGSTTTNSSGYYSFSDIDPGDFTICAVASGYDEGCRAKTVEEGITNWGSLLLEPGGDDDDAGDDDDQVDDDDVGDDDDQVDDDDAGDDDDQVDDDDAGDDDDDAAVGGDRRSNVPGRRGCQSSIAARTATPALLLILLAGATLACRRRD